MIRKAILLNDTCLRLTAVTWREVGEALTATYPGDVTLKRIAKCVTEGVLREPSWMAVEMKTAFTITAHFGSAGLAMAAGWLR